MSRTKRCARTLLALAVGLALLAGCKTQTVVDVAVRPDGSGRVAVLVFLDADAAARAGDLGKVLKVSDLEARGWKVIGPGPTAQVEASRTASAVDARSILRVAPPCPPASRWWP